MPRHWKKVTLAAISVMALVPASAMALTIIGTRGNDAITGSAQHDRIASLSGDDEVSSGDGLDLVRAGDGADKVDGGAGPDPMAGGRGNDLQYGGPGDDRIYALQGADASYGGPGADRLWGRSESDVPLDGVDELHGDEGHDFLLARDGEADLIDCGEGRDVALLDAVDVIVDATAEDPDGSCELVVRRPPRPGVDEPAP